MKKYKVKSAVVTLIFMFRWDLITKESVEYYYNGKNYQKDSVNDDLESFFDEIRLGNLFRIGSLFQEEPKEEISTYFLPTLTEEELELVERRDNSYTETFFSRLHFFVRDSNNLEAFCFRKTYKIENSS